MHDAAADPGLLAGAGRARIEIPPDAFPVDGFTTELDALHARTLLLADDHAGDHDGGHDGGTRRLALVVVDQTSISDELLAAIRAVTVRAAEVHPDDVVVCASHTFSAPHVLAGGIRGPADGVLASAIEAAVRQCATTAMQTLRPARVGFGTGRSGVNVNRDVPTADGWWLGANESGESDKTVAVVRVDGLDGRPIALLMNHAVQPSIMNGALSAAGGKIVTADLAGAAARHVEQQYEAAVALFLVGAAGDQAPYLTANRYALDKDRRWYRVDLDEAGYPLVELLGERLGAEVVRVAERIRAVDGAPALRVVHQAVTVPAQVATAVQEIRPTRNRAYRMAGEAQAPITVVQVGEIAFVGLQVELGSATGREIKRGSPFEHTIVGTMVNGAAKYMPDAKSYDRITYEAMASRYAKGSAEILTNRVLEILTGLKA